MLVYCFACCVLTLPIVGFLCYINTNGHWNDPFEKLMPKERWAVLRYILKKEINHLKIELPVKLVASGELTENVLGTYYPKSGVIAINKRLLTAKHPDSTLLIEVLTHELQHVKDFQDLWQIDRQTYSFMTVEQQNVFKQLAQNVITYKSAYEEGYAEQLIEQRAQVYSKKRVDYYRIRLPEIVTAYLKHQAKRRDTDSERK